MQIQVRDTEPQEHEAIFRIESHPLVRRHQYPWRWGTTYAIWRSHNFGARAASSRPTFSTILLDGSVVGSISYYRVATEVGNECHCGWNLDPERWGQGIMPAALSSWIERQFAEFDSFGIVADRFHNNDRCRRVLEKLNFQQVRVGVFDRFMTMARTDCFRWIIRHRLTRVSWEAAKNR